jgi:hypothetical protein
MFFVDQEDWDNPTTALNYGQKYYYAGMHNAAVKGFLPNYRLMALDLSSPSSKLMIDQPTKSSCKEFAESIRQMLRLEFEWVDNVHSMKRGSVSAAEFKECVNQSWKWLDGNSLLQE